MNLTFCFGIIQKIISYQKSEIHIGDLIIDEKYRRLRVGTKWVNAVEKAYADKGYNKIWGFFRRNVLVYRHGKWLELAGGSHLIYDSYSEDMLSAKYIESKDGKCIREFEKLWNYYHVLFRLLIGVIIIIQMYK